MQEPEKLGPPAADGIDDAELLYFVEHVFGVALHDGLNELVDPYRPTSRVIAYLFEYLRYLNQLNPQQLPTIIINLLNLHIHL